MDFMTTMAGSTLFKGLPEDELRQLERISEPREFDKGDMLFQEGREGIGFYVVAAGQVKVFKVSFDGREQILHILGPGDPLGEVPVFAPTRTPFTATQMAVPPFWVAFSMASRIDSATEGDSTLSTTERSLL